MSKKSEKNLSTKNTGIYQTVQLFEDNRDAAMDIITELLARPPVVLQVQREMLNPPHMIEATTVGQFLMPEAERELERLRREGDAKEVGAFEALLRSLKNPADMSFVERFGLVIVAPIILVPAAIIAAPVGVVASFVHLAKKWSSG